MPTEELPDAVSSAYAGYRAVGNETFDTTLAKFVVNGTHPRVWSANHISRVTASTPTEIEAVFAEMEERFAHCEHRAVVTDCFTPPSFVARLAFDGYREETPVIQMVLLDELTPIALTSITLRVVNSNADWSCLKQLVEIDFKEGLRTGHKELPLEVVRGIVDGYRRKSPVQQFFIDEIDDLPCAYGSAVECPNNLGMLEDFFTLPEFRGRGIASAIVSHCVGHLRKKASRSIFIGALMTERAKRLYAKLGFTPLMISREWVNG